MNDILQSYDFGEWFENISVTFFIRSEAEELIPARVSEFLGIQPSRSFGKGDLYLGKIFDPLSKKKLEVQRERPISLWEVSTKGIANYRYVKEHVLYLLDILEPVQKKLNFYLTQRDKYTVVVRIDASWDWETKNLISTGYTLESKILMRLANICHYVEYNFDKFSLSLQD